MAFGRRPYTTKFRPWLDSTDEVDLIWYNAADDAPALGFPSKIVQLDNATMPWIAQGVGEVFGAARTFNNRRAPAFQTFAHVCGTRDDFEFGDERKPLLPDVLYDRNDIPICCGPAFVGQGGGVGSGTATVTVTPGAIRYRFQTSAPGYTFDEILYHRGPPDNDWYTLDGDWGLQVVPEGPLPFVWLGGAGNAVLTFVAIWSSVTAWDGFGTRVFTNIFQTSPTPAFGSLTVTRL